MGSATLGKVALGCLRKVAESATGSKAVSTVPAWSRLRLLPRLPSMVDWKVEDEISPFLSTLLLVMVTAHWVGSRDACVPLLPPLV